MKRAGALCVAGSALLLVSSVLAQSSKTDPKKSAPPQDYSFKVTASQVWTDTGLDLEAGDRVHVYGTVMACEGPTPSEKAHLPLPSAPGGSLLVKVHAETAPILASPDADLPILDASHLYLGVNGWHCHGTIPAKVHVDWHKRPEDKH
jgi:hypothetical protein